MTDYEVKRWDSDCGEWTAYVTPSEDEESPKRWYQGDTDVLFVTAENDGRFKYTEAIFDEVYPAVGNSWQDLLDHVIDDLEYNNVISPPVCKPLWIHDHGGIVAFHTGGSTCQWDSYQCGWVIGKPGIPERTVDSRVKEMELYLTGQVYGVIVLKKTDEGEWERVDSNWGIYDDGTNDYAHCFMNAVDLGFPFSNDSEESIPREDA